jgi:hypothetical protein
LPREPNRTKYTSIYRWRGHHHKKRGVLDHWLQTNLRQPGQVKAKIKSD